jgi:hypothetical protein
MNYSIVFIQIVYSNGGNRMKAFGFLLEENNSNNNNRMDLFDYTLFTEFNPIN